MFSLVVCVDSNWGIAKNGQLLEWIPEDLKNFQKITKDSVVVMGKTTFQSLPNGPLKNRINVVLTRDKKFKSKDVVICNSVEECIKKVKKYNKNIFIIGGSQIYQQFLPHCDKAHVTKIFNDYNADTFMVNLDNEKNWMIDSWGSVKNYKNIQYQHYEYVRIK